MTAPIAIGNIDEQPLTQTAIGVNSTLVDDPVALVDDPNVLVGSQTTPIPDIKASTSSNAPMAKIVISR